MEEEHAATDGCCGCAVGAHLAAVPRRHAATSAHSQHALSVRITRTSASAKLSWGCSEMHVSHPARAAVGPLSPAAALSRWLSSGLPYRLCRWAWERTLPESSDTSFAANGRWPVVANAPWLLFLLPRIAMLLLSVASDLALYRAARTWLPRGSARAVLAAYGAAFPALVFTGRTFSNAMETALLAASLWIASVAIKRARSGSLRPASSSLSTAPVAATDRTLDAMCLLFGVVVGAAAFVRLSFLFWAWPIGVALIAAHFSMRRRASMRWFDVATAVVSSAAHVSFLVALPCAAVALVLCVADSLFYRTLWLCDGDAHTDRCSSGIIEGLDALATALLSGKMPHFRVSSSESNVLSLALGCVHIIRVSPLFCRNMLISLRVVSVLPPLFSSLITVCFFVDRARFC